MHTLVVAAGALAVAALGGECCNVPLPPPHRPTAVPAAACNARARAGAHAATIVLTHEVTTPGDAFVAVRLRACAVAPQVAPGLAITGGDDTTVTGAQVLFGVGHQPAEDVLAVDPDPTVECAWQRTCSPCFPLTVSPYDSTAGLIISGTGSRELYGSCLRRVVYSNTAFGGTETLGRREVIFSVTSYDGGDVGTTLTTSASGYVDVAPQDEDACGAALTRYATTFDNPTPPQTYYATCAASCPDAYSRLLTSLTLTQPNAPPGGGRLQAARVLFTPCTKRGGCPGVYEPDEDMLMVRALRARARMEWWRRCPTRWLCGTEACS
jgi:hypothetical protein